jgi:hypothetical protein
MIGAQLEAWAALGLLGLLAAWLTVERLLCRRGK